MIIFSLGTMLTLFGPGSYWEFAHMWNTLLGRVLGGLYVGYRVYVNIVLLARVGKEDEVLRKEFKEEWTQWARATPYKLVPFVY